MKQLSPAAQCAKLIRQELKTAFPDIKFRVHSENYSGGDAVNIYWTDGPLHDSIDAIVSKYQYGNFNSSIDLYEYSNKITDLPQAKYVFCNREMSAKAQREISEELSKSYGIDFSDSKAVFEQFHAWPEQVIYLKFEERHNY